jgi:hypothetical protein
MTGGKTRIGKTSAIRGQIKDAEYSVLTVYLKGVMKTGMLLFER